MIKSSRYTPVFPPGTIVDLLRVRLVERDARQKVMACAHLDQAGEAVTVRYGIAPENHAFNPSVELFREGDRLNLVDCRVDKEGFVIPSYIVLEPDYLIDASAIAECFQGYSISPLHYFRDKFMEVENRSYLLLGNLANFFLDELVFANDPGKVSFMEAFQRSFKNSPFEYASCEDIRSPHDFKEFMQKAWQQFENIRRVVQSDFPRRGIDIHQCTLEPSFFSERFGFQGRLDLWHPGAGERRAGIVELKSGRLPFPVYDRDKIALNHEAQTAVYRLMLESVFGESRDMDAFILYSAGDRAGENLRDAAKDDKLEKAILNTRNLIVAQEKQLVEGDNKAVASLFDTLFKSINGEGKLPRFFTSKIAGIEARLKQSSKLEKSYFYRYTRFISRELYHQKIGDIARETPTGVASLWNSTFRERAEALDILYNLSIRAIEDTRNGMTIYFSREEGSSDLVNFREGDICILYPRENEADTVLNQQILKGSIVSIRPGEVVVRFRYKQKNRRYFDENRLWAIEHDALDSSCTGMYKGLFAFLGASKRKRDLLLGQVAPEMHAYLPVSNTERDAILLDEPAGISMGQRVSSSPGNKAADPGDIIARATKAKDYFLIVGPPGTGKTSIFARRLIETYHAEPGTNIMVLAYTNRAVDELCQAIHAGLGNSAGVCDAYIRVGSELSCAPPYRHRLLQRIAEQSVDRQSLLAEIDGARIFVSTLASLNGRLELFDLKHFHVAIIDEASQILEPQIIGLLPRFDRFVMIGDHHQLSTIVLQDRAHSEVEEPLLQEAGILDCRDSLFERLMRRCLEKGWHHAHVQLTHQGRMHEEIAAFPAIHFYPAGLFSANYWQSEEWDLSCQSDHPFHVLVAKERTAFISTERMIRPVISTKVNETEADVITALLHALRDVYRENGKQLDAASVGIIAPYRNQIALIRQKLLESGLPETEKIMIETVERFQGSQRDVILVSFCVNDPSQMDFLCNMNRDGTVDRKLNVAITRARQQLFLVGNARVLRQHPIHALLLDHYRERTLVPETPFKLFNHRG